MCWKGPNAPSRTMCRGTLLEQRTPALCSDHQATGARLIVETQRNVLQARNVDALVGRRHFTCHWSSVHFLITLNDRQRVWRLRLTVSTDGISSEYLFFSSRPVLAQETVVMCRMRPQQWSIILNFLASLFVMSPANRKCRAACARPRT